MRPACRPADDLLLAARAPESAHHVDRVELAALLATLELAEHLLRDELGGVRQMSTTLL